jgi:malate dehydrogenase
MVKVAVLGAAGGIGQPLSLLLKLNQDVTHLSLYDIVNVPGVAADLSHINTNAKVTAHVGAEQLNEAVKDSHVVVIPAGIPRKPGMTRDDLFKINAGIVRDLAVAIAKHAPKAYVLIISNPVNSTVPIVARVFQAFNVFDPKRLFGVTTLDSVRASTFVSEVKSSLAPANTRLPIIGGHSGPTIVPLFSNITPSESLSQDELEKLTKRVQYGGDEVVQAKGGAGSATLSMAHAGARFAVAIINATVNHQKVVESAYVHLSADSEGASQSKKLLGEDLEFFAYDVQIGSQGTEKIIVPTKVTDFETKLIAEAVKELQVNISKGDEFAKSSDLSKL